MKYSKHREINDQIGLYWYFIHYNKVQVFPVRIAFNANNFVLVQSFILRIESFISHVVQSNLQKTQIEQLILHLANHFRK